MLFFLKNIFTIFLERKVKNQTPYLPMMLKLLGEFDCTMDAKGRVRLPSQLTRQLGAQERHEFVLAVVGDVFDVEGRF